MELASPAGGAAVCRRRRDGQRDHRDLCRAGVRRGRRAGPGDRRHGGASARPAARRPAGRDRLGAPRRPRTPRPAPSSTAPKSRSGASRTPPSPLVSRAPPAAGGSGDRGGARGASAVPPGARARPAGPGRHADSGVSSQPGASSQPAVSSQPGPSASSAGWPAPPESHGPVAGCGPVGGVRGCGPVSHGVACCGPRRQRPRVRAGLPRGGLLRAGRRRPRVRRRSPTGRPAAAPVGGVRGCPVCRAQPLRAGRPPPAGPSPRARLVRARLPQVALAGLVSLLGVIRLVRVRVVEHADSRARGHEVRRVGVLSGGAPAERAEPGRGSSPGPAPPRGRIARAARTAGTTPRAREAPGARQPGGARRPGLRSPGGTGGAPAVLRVAQRGQRRGLLGRVGALARKREHADGEHRDEFGDQAQVTGQVVPGDRPAGRRRPAARTPAPSR